MPFTIKEGSRRFGSFASVPLAQSYLEKYGWAMEESGTYRYDKYYLKSGGVQLRKVSIEEFDEPEPIHNFAV